MNINLRDGIFLGKEELLRIRDFQNMERDSKNFLFDSGWYQSGLYGVYANSIAVADYRSTMGGFCFYAKGISGFGRVVVGFDIDGKIALPSSDSLFDPIGETFLQASQLPTETQKFAVVYLASSTTNYEKALATIDSDGTVTISSGWQYVSHLFRTTASGKPSLIKTEGGQLLTVTEVREVGAVGYLTVESSTAITEEEDVKFMFMQTVSPFSNEEPQPLYTYDSSTIGVSAFSGTLISYKDACEQVFDDGSNIPIAIWTLGNTASKKLELLTPDYFAEAGSYTLLDTVRDNQITNRHIKDNTIAESKLAFNAHGFGNFVEDTGGQDFTAIIPPDSVCVMDSNNNVSNHRFIQLTSPVNADLVFCVTHPSRVILKPEVDDTANYELRELFKSDGVVGILFPESQGSDNHTSGEEYEIFDLYWVDRTTVMVLHKKYSTL